MSHWLELSYHIHDHHLPELEYQLEQLSVAALTLEDAADQPILEPDPGTTHVWQTLRAKALFPLPALKDADITGHTLDRKLRHALPWLETLSPVEIRAVAAENWQRRCMQDFKPMCFGEALWVVPSWHQAPAEATTHIVLDPGLAFGTGTHETTALCLEWLATHVKPGIKVIDYGCGSGVLAIAAIALGATFAWAVDYDPQACLACAQNAHQNQMQTQIQCHSPETFRQLTEQPQVNLLVANILAEPLTQLADTFSSLVPAGATLLMSGILDPQGPPLIATYEAAGFGQFETQSRNGWSLISALKN